MKSDEINPKRIKLDEALKLNSMTIKIESILADDMKTLPPVKNYIAGKIIDRKSTSAVMKELAEKMPIECGVYVKRVNKDNEVLICAAEEIFDETNLKTLLINRKISEKIAEIITKEVRIVEIPDFQPQLRWQFEKVTKSWPCKFHENKYLENLFSDSLFTDAESKNHQKFIEVCKFLSVNLNSVNVAIAVNPYSNRIIAYGSTKTHLNPILHCVMDLIDNVAVTQDGGAFSTSPSSDYLELAQKVTETFEIPFGECDFPKSPTGDDNLHKFGPYLCTGYSIYALNEPCLMCSMALIHSRAKRVFYNQTRPDGALGSMTKLHTNKNLNHRFEAFHVVLS